MKTFVSASAVPIGAAGAKNKFLRRFKNGRFEILVLSYF